MTILSIISAVYNEEEVLPFFFERTTAAAKKTGLEYELIMVNDGSADSSLEILKKNAAENDSIRVVSFSRNFGQQTALTAGLMAAKGDIVMILDSDLQDPPELLNEFIEKWKQGFKVIYGVRQKRKENLFKRFSYHLFYRILNFLSKGSIPLDSGDFCLMDRVVVNALNSFPERTRFIRGLRSWVGFKQIGVEYERDKRLAGEAKYTFTKLIQLAADGLFSFSEFPLKLSITSGLVLSLLCVVFAVYVIIAKLMGSQVIVTGWASVMVGIIFLCGFQLLTFGILGGYITKIFNEVKQRPYFIIEETIGIDTQALKNKSNNSSVQL